MALTDVFTVTSPQPPPRRQKTPWPSPILGLVAFTVALTTACALPVHFMLRRRLLRLDEALETIITSKKRYDKELFLTWNREAQQLRSQLENIQARIDKVNGDVKDIRNVLLKERSRLESIDSRLESLNYQVDSHDSKVLGELASQKRKMQSAECDMSDMKRSLEQNAAKLGRVGHALGDVAGFIDMTELEQGILRERGKGNTRWADSLRTSAMGVLEDKKAGAVFQKRDGDGEAEGVDDAQQGRSRDSLGFVASTGARK